MKIGILGAGNIGGTLGRLWTAKGHEVMFGVRDVNSPKTQAALKAGGPRAKAGSLAEAAAFGEVVVLAIHWPAVREALPTAGNLAGKILIDCTNRFAPPAPDDGPFAAADVARLAPGARVFKAFNTLGAETIANSEFGGLHASTFVCGDDAEGKAIVMQLAADTGLDARDAGPFANAQLAEGMTKLWASLTRTYGRGIAFRLLQR